MITLIEALNFRCLRYVQQPLGPFHVLIGPNASGKTTFLDVISILGSLVSEGLDVAVGERTKNFQDLVWGRSGDSFELAIEAGIPADRRVQLGEQPYDTVRYEVRLGNVQGETEILAEKVLLKKATPIPPRERTLFPDYLEPPQTILTPKGKSKKYGRTVVNKVYGGNDNYYSEVYSESGKGWAPAFKLGPRKSALGNLPQDESKFPVATWLKGLLTEGVQQFILNSLLLRRASPPGQVRGFKPDGSNLPWVVARLWEKAPERFRDWIAHLQTALPDLENIQTIVREDDKHCYLVLVYRGGLSVPSWMASDGTLRLLALTLPAYLPDFKGIYLIEEPENGIHPRAVETMFQSLSSVYNAQILLATHSPVILSLAEPERILCFARTAEGATDIVPGSEHPALKEWQGETNLGVLFAGGVLG
ncbi:MAG: ATP-binding protein [Bacillota bacterium]